jgi:hemerythrin-like domain-containing protein
MKTARREFLVTATALGCTGLTGVATTSGAEPAQQGPKQEGGAKPPAAAEDVSAPEDLMREHGVLRRILLVYEEGLRRLDGKQQVTPELFRQCATLLRKFIEDYHEKLEETFIFPVFERHGRLVPLVATLRRQHQAGRTLNDVVLRNATAERFAEEESQKEIARACRAFIRMYRPHAAREDTVLFPALHKLMSAAEMDKLGDQFEDEENRLFGQQGFERTVEQVAAIEKQLGILDLDQFTPKA